MKIDFQAIHKSEIILIVNFIVMDVDIMKIFTIN